MSDNPVLEPVRGVRAEPVARAENLHKSYIDSDGSELPILKGVDLEVASGEVVAVVGASGAGKSTLLHLLGGLDQPTSGEIFLAGQELSRLGEDELASIRNRRIGFIFQFHYLLREFTALENIMMPLLIRDVGRVEARRSSEKLIQAVGLGPRKNHKPSQLSGGERQRVAVARALVSDPLVLLADEPSGNLDNHTAEGLHDLFFKLREEHDVAVVLVTHNMELADRADRSLLLHDGKLNPAIRPLAEHETVP